MLLIFSGEIGGFCCGCLFCIFGILDYFLVVVGWVMKVGIDIVELFDGLLCEFDVVFV